MLASPDYGSKMEPTTVRKSPQSILVYFNEVDRVGHFAAWEQPELFSDQMRAAFKSKR
jgi:pimeloyl-ACP methyl ester carboxylesterase